LGRPLLIPRLEVVELHVGRDVVALARRDLLLRVLPERQELKQAFSRRLVLGEVPHAVEARQDRIEAAGRPDREAVRPAFLGDLRGIALGYAPGARRIEDQRALARDQPLVVRGVVPRRRVTRTEGHEPLAVLQTLLALFGLSP